ncbi:MAG: class I SAM-dependent methyltransferase [Candidatus Saganbacteria bacterium]|nr:class I SAM-dependent methyltransferase [Candidatus Saganbacteria bacterium]
MPIEKQINYYESLLSKHGEGDYRALDWKSPESQQMRYHVFEHLFSLSGRSRNFSILDVGCGFGDFFGYLKKRGYRINYTGYDISPKIITAAKRKFPEAKFEVKNILTEIRPERFDFVFCSGAFNIRFLDHDEHMEKVKEMLLRMFEISKIGVGANFLSSAAVYYIKEEEVNSGIYYYFKPEDLIQYTRSFCTRFMLRHDYHPGDFTTFLLK